MKKAAPESGELNFKFIGTDSKLEMTLTWKFNPFPEMRWPIYCEYSM